MEPKSEFSPHELLDGGEKCPCDCGCDFDTYPNECWCDDVCDCDPETTCFCVLDECDCTKVP
jgi:hypothetical protein